MHTREKTTWILGASRTLFSLNLYTNLPIRSRRYPKCLKVDWNGTKRKLIVFKPEKDAESAVSLVSQSQAVMQNCR
nr:hypothetical protein CFP56_60082 [Quercus suber]